MTWAGAMAAIKANCVLAAADVTPPITVVRTGLPSQINADTIAIWPSGTRSPGNTFGQVHLERGVQVTAYLRGSTRADGIDEATETRLVAIEAALLTRLWADSELGGNAIGIAIESTDYDWFDIGSQVGRVLTFVVWVWLQNVATISP